MPASRERAQHPVDRAPARLIARQWRRVIRAVPTRVRRDHVVLLSGGITFYGFIAVFPTLAAALLLYGLAADPAQVQRQVLAFTSALPPEALRIIEEFLARPAGADSSVLSWGFGLALVGALWTSSAGVAGLVEGINAAYNEVGGRSALVGFTNALPISMVSVGAGIRAVGPKALATQDERRPRCGLAGDFPWWGNLMGMRTVPAAHRRSDKSGG